MFSNLYGIHSSKGKGDRGKKTSDRARTWELPTSRMSPKKRKTWTTRSMNEGGQSFCVSEGDVDGSILAISNTLEAGVQVGSSCKQL